MARAAFSSNVLGTQIDIFIERSKVMQQQAYPVHFSVDYPDRPLDRLTTFFRLFMVLPIAVVLGVLSGGNWQWTVGGNTITAAAGTGGVLFLATLLMIL